MSSPISGGNNEAPDLTRTATRIGKIGSVYMAGSFVPTVAAIFLLPVFTRYLVPEQMGIIRLSVRIMTPLRVLIGLGLTASLQSHYFRTERERHPELVRTFLLGQLGFALIFCGLLSLAGLFFADALLPNLPLAPRETYLLWLILVGGAFAGVFTGLGVKLMQLRERPFSVISLRLIRFTVQAILGIGAVVLLGWKGLGRQFTLFLGGGQRRVLPSSWYGATALAPLVSEPSAKSLPPALRLCRTSSWG